MKSYNKYQLAMMAGVSRNTFARWMKRYEDIFLQMGVSKNTRLLPPIAVKFVCDHYGIDLE